MNAAHTPTPYSAANYQFGSNMAMPENVWRIYMPGNTTAFVTGSNDADTAAFIVRACNSHDALVSALKSVRNDLRSFCGVVARSNGVHSAKAVAADKRYRDVLAALAAAGETP